ncbi:MAG: serine hydrolase domain-containing protein [Candidatus Korobacteraceae bacterium]
MRTLSNSTTMPSFDEQAIISGASIRHICEVALKQASQPLAALRPAFADQERQFARAFAIIREAIERHAFPSAALAVTHRGALVASQGFGRFTYDEGAPQIQAETIFDLASVTKVVATTAVAMLLHERRQLPLDAPLAKFLPEFVSLVPRHQQTARETVTIRMLLSHSNGLPAYEKLFQFAQSREELVRAALTTRLVATPGTRTEYSDIGFILLGEVLALQADLPLDLYARQEIFTPLGMTRTRFNPPNEWKTDIPPTEDDRTFRKRVIQGEVNDENAYVMNGVAGHAGVFAPATDVARFAECMLRGGAPLFQSATVKLFTRRPETPSGTSRALGWDTPSPPDSSAGSRFSQASFGHLGFTGTSLWIDPGRQLSVTLLTNRTWPDRASQAIRQVRPLLHDAIVEALEEPSR